MERHACKLSCRFSLLLDNTNQALLLCVVWPKDTNLGGVCLQLHA